MYNEKKTSHGKNLEKVTKTKRLRWVDVW